MNKQYRATTSLKRRRVEDDDRGTDTDDDNDDRIGGTASKPKDLSDIFPEFASSPSPRTKIAKRMLVRSRTEPALASSPKLPIVISPAASLPIINSSPPASPSPSRPNPSLRTYSQSRSFLVPIPVTTATPNSKDDDLRESYADLRSRWGVDNSEDDPYHVPGITNELMSMSELRSKGESRRFLDEVGYLFEGLEQPAMSATVKRSSAQEIVLKMCDPDFVRKAKAADFIPRAWDAITLATPPEGDKLLDPCLAFFLALVARNSRDANDLARRDSFFPPVLRLLHTTTDNDSLLLLPLKIRISKSERVALTNLRNIITKSSLLPPSTPPTTRLLASRALVKISPDLLPPTLLSPLLATLEADLALINTSDPTPHLPHIEQCLRILDSFLLGTWGPPHGQTVVDAMRDYLAPALVSLCTSAASLEAEAAPESSELARQSIESTFRVLINLSHSSPAWCTALLPGLPSIVPHVLPLAADEDALDRQCLALGLLTNIVFATEDAAKRLTELQLDPTCPRNRCCVPACNCPGRITSLAALVRLFTEGDVKAETSSADTEFFRSHLAALLCLLSVGSPAVQRVVRPARVGESVRKFLEFYAGLGGAEDEDGERGVKDAMASRVKTALEALEA